MKYKTVIKDKQIKLYEIIRMRRKDRRLKFYSDEEWYMEWKFRTLIDLCMFTEIIKVLGG